MEPIFIFTFILIALSVIAIMAAAWFSRWLRTPVPFLSVTWNWTTAWRSGKKAQRSAFWLQAACAAIALALAAMLVGPAVVPARAALAQPILAQMAAQQPDQQVAVIVQKAVPGSALEAEVARLGGKVTQDLRIINAFGATMRAADALELARMPGVRWVSLDAPTISTTDWSTPDYDPLAVTYAVNALMDGVLASPTYITWATAPGTLVAMGFNNALSMYDSALGPNGTFGYGGDKVKGSFGGFEAQVTPGTSISKVELVLHAYMPKYIEKVFKYQVYVGGVRVTEIRPNTSIFVNNIGAANAGPVYLDVTGTRSWQWADLSNDLQVVIDQSGIASGNYIYYDAIGLRVTSVDGNGGLAVGESDTTALATIDTASQVNVYNKVIRATDLWNSGAKIQGKGIGVAVIDSGVQRNSDLGKRLRTHVNFNRYFHNATDRYGHGTFVSGIVAGKGSLSSGKYIGVAPRADIYNIRVSDDTGMSIESDVIAALQWIYEHKAEHNIRVVNLSLNSSVPQSYHTSPLDAACEILWFNGFVVVAAAGNNGGGQVLYPPANDPFIITVGATDDMGTASITDDAVTGFSAYGVTEDGFLKPDLVAPGKNIIGVLPDNNKLTLGILHPENRIDKNYFRMSGTSVSAPIVSGAVALLLQDEPGLNPDQVKYRLMATANQGWAGFDPAKAGAGLLDVYAAVNGTSTQPANTGLTASGLLTTGTEPITSSVSWNSVSWNSVSWNSVSWNSVSWNSVSWNSVSWNSVSWNTDYWGQ